MEVVGQLNLKKKEKHGNCGVILTNPNNIFCVLILVFFTFRNVKIHETVDLCRKKKQFAIVIKTSFQKQIYMYLLP